MNVSVPSGETAGCTTKRFGLLVVTTKVTICDDSFAGPGEMPLAQPETDCAPRSETATRFPPPEKPGASFTGRIVKVNDAVVESSPPFAVPPLSRAVTVTVAEPFASAAGVNVSVPSAATAGAAANKPGLLADVSKLTVCDDSEAGPGVIPDAQPTA